MSEKQRVSRSQGLWLRAGPSIILPGPEVVSMCLT